jgi:hypothetical protein
MKRRLGPLVVLIGIVSLVVPGTLLAGCAGPRSSSVAEALPQGSTAPPSTSSSSAWPSFIGGSLAAPSAVASSGPSVAASSASPLRASPTAALPGVPAASKGADRLPASSAPTAPWIGYRVSGSFAYRGPDAVEYSVDVSGFTDTLTLGEWTVQALPDGPRLPVSIDWFDVSGSDAFISGYPSGGNDRAGCLVIHDGGLPGGAGDQAVMWLQESAQEPAELFASCGPASALPGPGPFPLTSGELVIEPE